MTCERLYQGSYDHPLQAEVDIAQFIGYYNGERLHQGIGFVTPQERHEGRDTQLREERSRGLRLARLVRFIENGASVPGRGLGSEVGAIKTRERSPVLRSGVNEEVAGGQDCSIIFPVAVS